MALILVISALFALFCTTVPPQIFDGNQLIIQLSAVFLSLAFTAIVTYTLLSHQFGSEEVKDKNVKIHENKVKAYSNFLKTLWCALDDGIITREEIKKTRSKLFEQVFFYLDNKGLDCIEKSINRFKSRVESVNKPEENVSSKANSFYREFATSIALCLKNDVIDEEEGGRKSCILKISSRKHIKSQDTNMDGMWNTLEYIASKYPPLESEEGRENTESAVSVRKLKSQAWHFSEWSEAQLQYLQKGGKELSLVEYDEYWRTNLVQQVKPGDVVFLFKGNWKYAGVFIAKGWRVFEYDEQRYVKEITSDGIEKAVVTGDKVLIDSVKDKLAKYDIYDSYLDSNSTSCANVVVDTISFIPDGVETPNTTYRKAISRYYWEYAVRLLDKFNEVENEQNQKKIAELYK